MFHQRHKNRTVVNLYPLFYDLVDSYNYSVEYLLTNSYYFIQFILSHLTKKRKYIFIQIKSSMMIKDRLYLKGNNDRVGSRSVKSNRDVDLQT
jgi:hypothetical protein